MMMDVPSTGSRNGLAALRKPEPLLVFDTTRKRGTHQSGFASKTSDLSNLSRKMRDPLSLSILRNDSSRIGTVRTVNTANVSDYNEWSEPSIPSDLAFNPQDDAVSGDTSSNTPLDDWRPDLFSSDHNVFPVNAELAERSEVDSDFNRLSQNKPKHAESSSINAKSDHRWPQSLPFSQRKQQIIDTNIKTSFEPMQVSHGRERSNNGMPTSFHRVGSSNTNRSMNMPSIDAAHDEYHASEKKATRFERTTATNSLTSPSILPNPYLDDLISGYSETRISTLSPPENSGNRTYLSGIPKNSNLYRRMKKWELTSTDSETHEFDITPMPPCKSFNPAGMAIHYTISQDWTGNRDVVCQKLLAAQNKSSSQDNPFSNTIISQQSYEKAFLEDTSSDEEVSEVETIDSDDDGNITLPRKIVFNSYKTY